MPCLQQTNHTDHAVMLSNRVVDEWNMLHVDVISSNLVSSFKLKLSRYIKNFLAILRTVGG